MPTMMQSAHIYKEDYHLACKDDAFCKVRHKHEMHIPSLKVKQFVICQVRTHSARRWFCQWLEESSSDFRMGSEALQGLEYGVFGSGNSLYEANYNKARMICHLLCPVDLCPTMQGPFASIFLVEHVLWPSLHHLVIASSCASGVNGRSERLSAPSRTKSVVVVLNQRLPKKSFDNGGMMCTPSDCVMRGMAGVLEQKTFLVTVSLTSSCWADRLPGQSIGNCRHWGLTA